MFGSEGGWTEREKETFYNMESPKLHFCISKFISTENLDQKNLLGNTQVGVHMERGTHMKRVAHTEGCPHGEKCPH